MQYEGRIFRPPSEAHSLIVQATVGCSHNKCTFCSMYKEKQFHMRDLQDVLDDLTEMAGRYPDVRRIFLADGDALILPMERLEAILTLIREKFVHCERVGIYGSPRSILRKTPEELRSLRELGLGIVYLGLESGSDEILKRVNKGETADEIVTAGLKVKEAGIPLSVTAVSGLGGKELWREHAQATGKAFTRMKPDYIGLLTLLLEDDVPLERDFKAGVFELLSPEEIALETLVMLKNMDCEGSVFRSNHASNYISLRGTLNRDRETMMGQLRDALEGNAAYKKEPMRAL
ncbi:MAG: radical SAM protein [Christensenella sp.]|uniref:radical SAM protein n=1 Tax=Christensenella sp. TaxID=1935934 RepID=UPI002B2142CC|nr:radical SAM protein [Christensenella sp.]MEA5002576.1 radical SAM protein [Christensenella sp.]